MSLCKKRPEILLAQRDYHSRRSACDAGAINVAVAGQEQLPAPFISLGRAHTHAPLGEIKRCSFLSRAHLAPRLPAEMPQRSPAFPAWDPRCRRLSPNARSRNSPRPALAWSDLSGPSIWSSTSSIRKEVCEYDDTGNQPDPRQFIGVEHRPSSPSPAPAFGGQLHRDTCRFHDPAAMRSPRHSKQIWHMLHPPRSRN